MKGGGLSRPRLLPVVIVAGLCLLALKLLGLMGRGGYLIAPTLPVFSRAPAPPAPALSQRYSAPEIAADITGSVPPKEGKDKGKSEDKGKAEDKGKPEDKGKTENKAKADDKGKGKDGKGEPAKEAAQPPPPPPPTAAEIEVLEKLAERRRQLDARMKELELREAMIKSAEKTLDDKLGELKQGETRAEAARATREGSAGPSLKSLVVMYEAMKPRDAARVFEKMEPRMLVTLARQMNPRKLSEVMAQMTPDAAEKLTAGLIRASTEGQAMPAAAPPAAAPSTQPELPELPRLKPAQSPKG